MRGLFAFFDSTAPPCRAFCPVEQPLLTASVGLIPIETTGRGPKTAPNNFQADFRPDGRVLRALNKAGRITHELDPESEGLNPVQFGRCLGALATMVCVSVRDALEQLAEIEPRVTLPH